MTFGRGGEVGQRKCRKVRRGREEGQNSSFYSDAVNEWPLGLVGAERISGFECFGFLSNVKAALSK